MTQAKRPLPIALDTVGAPPSHSERVGNPQAKPLFPWAFEPLRLRLIRPVPHSERSEGWLIHFNDGGAYSDLCHRQTD